MILTEMKPRVVAIPTCELCKVETPAGRNCEWCGLYVCKPCHDSPVFVGPRICAACETLLKAEGLEVRS